MSFDNFEISNELGQPKRLYHFRYGNSNWRYTSADTDITVGVNELGQPALWVAGAITDGGVTQGGSDQNDIQITIQANSPIPALFRQGQLSGKVFCFVRQYHLGDPASEMPLFWSGTIVNSVQAELAEEQLSGRSLGGTYDRQGLRLAWDRSCPHVIYGNGCRVDKDLHAYPRTIATVSGTGFTCTVHAEPAEGSFSGGFIIWVRLDGSLERRFIERQNGNDFQLLGTTVGLLVGTNVTIYPGCARDTPTCKLFDNLPNYGGFPHMPGKSPFQGPPVF